MKQNVKLSIGFALFSLLPLIMVISSSLAIKQIRKSNARFQEAVCTLAEVDWVLTQPLEFSGPAVLNVSLGFAQTPKHFSSSFSSLTLKTSGDSVASFRAPKNVSNYGPQSSRDPQGSQGPQNSISVSPLPSSTIIETSESFQSSTQHHNDQKEPGKNEISSSKTVDFVYQTIQYCHVPKQSPQLATNCPPIGSKQRCYVKFKKMFYPFFSATNQKVMVLNEKDVEVVFFLQDEEAEMTNFTISIIFFLILFVTSVSFFVESLFSYIKRQYRLSRLPQNSVERIATYPDAI